MPAPDLLRDPIERRALGGELRVAPDDPAGRRLRGYAIVFNTLSVDLGGFRERILPQAVQRPLREGADVRALVDHDASKVLGRTTVGTLRLRADARGLLAEIDPPDTTIARDLIESVRRGDISGMSFAFRVPNEPPEAWGREDGQVIRTVSDMELYEVSVVSFPAYPVTDVTVAQRSLRAFMETAPRAPTVAWLQRWHRTQLAR